MATVSYSTSLKEFVEDGIAHGAGSLDYEVPGNTKMRIMKGTVPTDFTGLQSLDARSEDLLVEWDSGTSGDADVFDESNIVITPYNAASQSGTATWFWWTAEEGDVTDDDAMSLQMVGTVGTSNADLIIGSTSIVEGKFYRISGLKFIIPQDYTY